MYNLKKLLSLFTKKCFNLPVSKSWSSPLLIIKKNTEDANVKEYNSIEEAIADLENDPNVPSDKIEKLKSSLNQLKNKTSIKISNGEIIK
jgi:hypothetical protein